GNVINGDILGARSTLPWVTAYSNPKAILQAGFSLCTPAQCVAYQPAAVYEALGTICIGIILYLLLRRNVRPGVHAISQLILFEFRASEPPGPLGLREAQWTSIAMLVLGVPLLYVLWRRTSVRFETRSPDGPSAAQEPAAAR